MGSPLGGTWAGLVDLVATGEALFWSSPNRIAEYLPLPCRQGSAPIGQQRDVLLCIPESLIR